MLFHAVLPAGSVPFPAAGAILICSAAGPIRILLDRAGRPVKQTPGDDRHAVCHFTCPAATLIAPAARFRQLQASFEDHRPIAPNALSAVRSDRTYAARAPPDYA